VYKWRQANADVPLCAPGKDDEITFMNLMSSNSLIQVYICTAIAQSFFQADVLLPLQLAHDDDAELQNRRRTRRFMMDDDQMHRLYRPFTCAMELCDKIKPSSLAYTVANYLAKRVPLYGASKCSHFVFGCCH
jgi:hypothetical protein